MENWLLVMKSVIGLLALKISNYFLADVMCGGGFRIENKLPKNAFRTCVERPKKNVKKKIWSLGRMGYQLLSAFGWCEG